MSEDVIYEAIKKVYTDTDEDISEPSFIKGSMSVVETVNNYIAMFFNFVLQMNPVPENNMIGFSRTIGLIIVVAFLGFVIVSPTILIYFMNYKSPHDVKNISYMKISNYQNKYIMITSSFWIIMFCTIILFCPIKAI
jgi:hypothetical protein